MKEVKARSSKYINDVYRYVQNQEKHHRKQKIKDEYVLLLQAFDVVYDEQYIFHEPKDYFSPKLLK